MGVNFKTKRTKSPVSGSILKQYSMLDIGLVNILGVNEDEGKKFINISSTSNSELGRRLSPVYARPFTTFLGKTGSMKSYMEAISTPGYPIELLRKSSKLTKYELSIIPKNTRKNTLANYWSLVAHAMCQRVLSDSELQQMLIDNKLEFVAYKVIKGKELFGKVTNMVEIDYNLGRYIGIIRYIEIMLKEGRFDSSNIEQFIKDSMDKPDKDLFEGLAVNVAMLNVDNNSAQVSNNGN